VDFDETFSPVVKPSTVRTVLSLALSRRWPIHQLDVKNALLHGNLTETVYCQQPSGFEDLAHPDFVCLLKKSLYSLKQAPHAWYSQMTTFLLSMGLLKPSQTPHSSSTSVDQTQPICCYMLMTLSSQLLRPIFFGGSSQHFSESSP
jgi:hypothetical protein